METTFPPGVLAAQAAERGLVRLFGGYTVGLAGGTLLVNERVPVPRFNFVQLTRVARERQTAFFESALDHYFQRALRPSFRLAIPVPAHLELTLHELSFRPVSAEEHWLIAGPTRPRRPTAGPGALPVPDSGLDDLVDLWVGPKGREEFRRQLSVGRSHPNPGERVDPFWLLEPDRSVRCAGLAYRRDGTMLLDMIATPEPHRGQGAATEWVRQVLATPAAIESTYLALRTSVPRLAERLAPLGFAPALSSRIYELPKDAALNPRVPLTSTGPRWRPPRIA